MKKNLSILLLFATILLFSVNAFSQTFSSERTIGITAPASLDLNSEFTVFMDLNTDITSLLTDNVDGNDIKITYDSLELDRRVEIFQGSGARLWFKIPEGVTISAGTKNSSFKLEYESDINIVAPKKNDANVFQRFYDFNGVTISSDFITANAVQNETLQIVDGAAWGDSYAFVNDLNFLRDWSATIEVDLNVGPSAGGMIGWNDGAGTTNLDMLHGHYPDSLTQITIQEDANTFTISEGANANYRLKTIANRDGVGAWYFIAPLTDFDLNNYHISGLNNQQVMRAGITVEPDNGTRVEYDNMKIYYDANFFGAKIAFTDVNGIFADINANPASPLVLDPENDITSRLADFNSISTVIGATISDYNWFVDGAQVSTDQNFTRNFTATGDFNITLIASGTLDADGNNVRSQDDLNYLVRNNAQGIDINFSFNPTAPTADVNYGVTTTSGTINYSVWGFPGDQNQTGLIAQKSYREGDQRNVCVTVNTIGDVNKTTCEIFYTTRVIAKKPIDITNLNELTPFDVFVSIVPSQSYTNVTVDQNFWFLSQAPDFNNYNLTVDANLSFFISNYLVALNETDLNQTIQPYMIPVTEGIEVLFTTKDALTNDIIIANVALFFSRDITGVGNTLVNSGITDALGRISFPFIPNIDHNFTVEFPVGTFAKDGIYRPVTADATNGVTILVPSESFTGDQNALGYVDVNFLQDTVTAKANLTVDLNQIVTSSRPISSITITIDHNGVELFSDTNSGAVATGGIFGQNISVSGLNRDLPLVVTFNFTFADTGTASISKGITIERGEGLFDRFVNAQDDLGGVAGTMIIISIILAILLGWIHVFILPSNIDNSHTFLLAAVVLLFCSFVGWVDGASWVIASLAGGAAYVMRRVPQ